MSFFGASYFMMMVQLSHQEWLEMRLKLMDVLRTSMPFRLDVVNVCCYCCAIGFILIGCTYLPYQWMQPSYFSMQESNDHKFVSCSLQSNLQSERPLATGWNSVGCHIDCLLLCLLMVMLSSKDIYSFFECVFGSSLFEYSKLYTRLWYFKVSRYLYCSEFTTNSLPFDYPIDYGFKLYE